MRSTEKSLDVPPVEKTSDAENDALETPVGGKTVQGRRRPVVGGPTDVGTDERGSLRATRQVPNPNPRRGVDGVHRDVSTRPRWKRECLRHHGVDEWGVRSPGGLNTV